MLAQLANWANYIEDHTELLSDQGLSLNYPSNPSTFHGAQTVLSTTKKAPLTQIGMHHIINFFFVCLFFKTSLGTSESHFAKSGRSRMTTGVVCDLVLAGAQSSLACLLVSRPSTMVPVTSGKDLEKRAIRLCSGKRATEVEPFF